MPKIIKSTYQPNTTMPATPCPKVSHIEYKNQQNLGSKSLRES